MKIYKYMGTSSDEGFQAEREFVPCLGGDLGTGNSLLSLPG